MSWQPASYKIAQWYGPAEVAGYVYRGLGLHMALKPSPKGRRPATWVLTHLNTGHRVFSIRGDVQTAFPIASEIAEMTDWDAITSIKGYINIDPELPQKIAEIGKRFAKHLDPRSGTQGSSDEIARAIMMERA